MAERQITDVEALANSAQIVGPGVQQPTDDGTDWDLALWRAIRRLADASMAAAGFEVVKDDSAALRILIRAGRLGDGSTAYDFAELGGQVVVASATNYVYLTVANLAGHSVTINQTAFPDPATTPHMPLATVVCGGTDFAYTDIADFRGRALLAILTALTADDANLLVGGTNCDALHLHAAGGIADGSIGDAKLELRYVSRPAAAGTGAIYFTGRPTDGQLLTIDGVTFEIDKDSSFPDSAGDFVCDCNASGDLAGDITAIAAAIAANSTSVWADADTARGVVWLTALTPGAAGNVGLATALSNTTVSNSTLTDGRDAAEVAMVDIRHAVTAAEAAAGVILLATGLMPTSAIVAMEDAGVASGVTVTYGGSNIMLTMGTPAWTAGDYLVVWAIGNP